MPKRKPQQANGKRSRTLLEYYEQKTLFEWAHLEPHPFLPGVIGDYLFSIPNGGGKITPNIRMQLQRTGLKKGVSDCFLPNRCGRFAGLWVEMKKRREHFISKYEVGRALSPDQKAWGSKMELCGYCFCACYGWEEARDVILKYLSLGDGR